MIDYFFDRLFFIDNGVLRNEKDEFVAENMAQQLSNQNTNNWFAHETFEKVHRENEGTKDSRNYRVKERR